MITRFSPSTLLRLGYAPLMLAGVNGAALILIDRGASHAWLAGLLAGAIALSFAVERMIPYRTEWNRDQGDATRDVLHAAVNELTGLVCLLLLPAVAGHLTLVDLWPRETPFLLQVTAAVLVFDAGVTLAHYASHHVGALWRLHAVHHSVKRFYGLNGLMKHPLHQLLELGAGALPLVLLGFTPEVATALAFLSAIQLLMQHSNADYRVGPLGRVLALNGGHRFHHLKWAGDPDAGARGPAEREEAVVNYGLFTLLWDHLLGTHRYEPERPFTSDDLGIGSEPDYPSSYLAQLAAPFRRRTTAPRIRRALLTSYVNAELHSARAATTRGDLDAAWRALERAHVLSQPSPWLHVRAHLAMLRLGLATRDPREVTGQLYRSVVAAPASALGIAPLGNIGRAHVPSRLPMPLAPEVRAALARAGALGEA